jgi:hypothetical protein
VAWRTTRSLTDPSMNREIALRPRWPSTRRSTPRCSATAMISAAGLPTAVTSSASTPSSARIAFASSSWRLASCVSRAGSSYSSVCGASISTCATVMTVSSAPAPKRVA